MVLKYSAKNFYSLCEETVVDFTLSPKSTLTHGAVLSDTEQKTHTVLGVFGANASGKTNLLKPFAILHYLFFESAKKNPQEALIPVDAFVFDDNTFLPSELSIEFELENSVYRYEIQLTKSRILFESLSKKKDKFSYLFKRVWNEKKKAYDFKSQGIGAAAHVPLRENAAWLSCALLQNHELALEFLPYMNSLTGNLDVFGRLDCYDGNIDNLMHVSSYYTKHQNILEKASSYLSKLDLGISKVKLVKSKYLDTDGKEKEVDIPLAIHQLNGKEMFLPMLAESRGTQTLFVMLTYLLPILESGGMAYIDEFESGLHPHMVRELVELFMNPATNPHKAQLIATFHSDFLLRDTFHKSQIYLVEKDEELKSQAYRLDEVKGIRTLDNIYEKYHAGAYGGIPNIL